MTTTTNRLGRTYLDQVLERDVDLLLLEELHCEVAFQKHLADAIFGPHHGYKFEGAWVSVTEASRGESDLVVVFSSGSNALAVLVENKIKAPWMPEQGTRYRLRGEEGIKQGWWQEYKTCLIAPERRLIDTNGNVFDHYISYESLLPHFRGRMNNIRGEWRAHIIEQAVKGATKSNYVMRPDESVTAFVLGYWELANREFPALRMRRPRQRPRGSDWIIFADVDVAKGVQLAHKVNAGSCVDLSFSNTTVEQLHKVIAADLEPDMHIEKAQKSAAIRIGAPDFNIDVGWKLQQEQIRTALRSAERLLHFYHKWRDRLHLPIGVR